MNGRVLRHIKNIAATSDEALAMYAIAGIEPRFRHDDLTKIYKLRDSEIELLVQHGSLEPIEVGARDAQHIAHYHKASGDRQYRKQLIERLERGCADLMEGVRKRRARLLKEVVLPQFGAYSGAVVSLPKTVSAKDVEDALRTHPDLLPVYPRNPYQALSHDIKALGIAIDGADRIRRTLTKRMQEDPVYRQKILENIGKAQKTPAAPEVKRQCAELARKKYMEPVQHRRDMLLRYVILPEFGTSTDNRWKLPEYLVLGDILEKVSENEKLLSLYPKSLSSALSRDIKSLGIDVAYAGIQISRRWKERLSHDPALLSIMRQRVYAALQARKRLYEQHPEKAQEAYRASAETRRQKMRTDEGFRALVMNCLSKGHAALWEKYRTDGCFRRKMRRKQLKALRRGNETTQRRVEERRRMLSEMIDYEFGGLDKLPYGSGGLTGYLQEERPAFLRKYFAGKSPKILKDDIAALRKAAGIRKESSGSHQYIVKNIMARRDALRRLMRNVFGGLYGASYNTLLGYLIDSRFDFVMEYYPRCEPSLVKQDLTWLRNHPAKKGTKSRHRGHIVSD